MFHSKKYQGLILRLFITLFIPFIVFAQVNVISVFADDNVSAEKGQNADDDDDKNSGIVPIAIPFYTPETSFGLGAGVVMYRRAEGDSSLDPDELEIEGFGTWKRQCEFNMSGTKFFRRNFFKLSFESEINRWTDDFYGIGNDVKDRNKEEYSQNEINFKPSFLVKAMSGLYLGPVLNISRYSMKDRESGGMLASNTIRGSDGTKAHGAGVIVEYSCTEGAEFYPRKGPSFNGEYIVYRKGFGSEYDFTSWILNHKQYFQISGNHIIALDGYVSAVNGDVPWQMLSELGGQERMRGYLEGKYRDKRYAALQAEYRFPIVWRITGVVFGGAGEIGRTFGDFSSDDIRVSGGAGLRFVLDEKEHIPLRLDFAMNTESGEPSIYFGLLEAF